MGVRGTIVAALGALLCLTPSAYANTYRPTKTGDHTVNGCTTKDCTFREALRAANNHAGRDSIVLRSGKRYKLAVNGSDDDARAGDFDVNSADGRTVTIRSSGSRRATVDAAHRATAFDVFTPLTLDGVIVERGGQDEDFIGGDVYLRSTHATIRNSVLAKGYSAAGGGLWIVGARAKLVDTVVRGNRSSGLGGGIYLARPGHLALNSSAVLSNRANIGGGIAVGDYSADAGAPVSEFMLRNDTIDGNHSVKTGSGFYVEGGIGTINATTVAHNSGAQKYPPGLDLEGGETTLSNSLLAKNTNKGLGRDCAVATYNGASLISGGHNLVAVNDDLCSDFVNHQNGDFIDADATPVRVGRPAMHGGPTPTDALGKGSKAIGRGGPSTPKLDQRGRKRHDPDIGAFERGA